MVERSSSLETAVATAGNFASSARPLRDHRWSLPAPSKDRDRPVTVELDFEDPIWRVEGSFRALRHHRGNEGWDGLLGHACSKLADEEVFRNGLALLLVRR